MVIDMWASPQHSSSVTADFPKKKQESKRKQDRKESLLEPYLQSVLLLLLPYQFIRSKPLGTFYTDGKGVKPGNEYQETGVTGSSDWLFTGGPTGPCKNTQIYLFIVKAMSYMLF